MESWIRIAADNNQSVPFYYLHQKSLSSWPTSDNRKTKIDLQLPTLPFSLAA